MPEVTRLPEPFMKAGDPISAKAFNKLARAARRSTLLPGTFTNGIMTVQALALPAGTSVSTTSARTLTGILVKTMGSAEIDGLAGALAPSDVVEDAVYILGEPTYGDQVMPAIPGSGGGSDSEESNLFAAVNRYWPYGSLWAGDGGGSNPPAMLVQGFLSAYILSSDSGASDENAAPLFVITWALNPLTIYRGTTTGPVMGGPWTATALERVCGRRLSEDQEELVDVDNPDGWIGPDGAYCLQAIRDDGTPVGLDLECPPEES